MTTYRIGNSGSDHRQQYIFTPGLSVAAGCASVRQNHDRSHTATKIGPSINCCYLIACGSVESTAAAVVMLVCANVRRQFLQMTLSLSAQSMHVYDDGVAVVVIVGRGSCFSTRRR